MLARARNGKCRRETPFPSTALAGWPVNAGLHQTMTACSCNIALIFSPPPSTSEADKTVRQIHKFFHHFGNIFSCRQVLAGDARSVFCSKSEIIQQEFFENSF
jgi:hypothetical protein